MLQPLVGGMDDLVDGEGGGGALRVLGIVARQFLGNLGQPFIELRLRTGVERREGADNAGLALGERQRGMGNDEQRRGHHGQSEMIGKDRWKSHGKPR